METKLTLTDIAGYATERMVWQMILDPSGDHGVSLLRSDGHEKAFKAPETFTSQYDDDSDAAHVWSLGAMAFYVLTGTDVFEGKGGQTQTADMDVPRISSAYASYSLSSLIIQCLSFDPSARPSMSEIEHAAQEALSKPAVSRPKLTGQSGKGYASSLVKFWPEEMVSVILLCMMLLFPTNIWAQSTFEIPNEMANLVLRCVDLRSPSNTEKVSKAMERDMKWTMMDELTVDRQGECTTKDMVDMFGLNDIGFGILKRHGGVTNTAGRFRDGRDPRYKYSFIEITVKKGNSVSYEISGREGEQLFAIVPFEQNAVFDATIPNGKVQKKDGICYIQLKQGLKKEDKFTLTITNKSGKNAAFALINYNSRNHE